MLQNTTLALSPPKSEVHSAEWIIIQIRNAAVDALYLNIEYEHLLHANWDTAPADHLRPLVGAIRERCRQEGEGYEGVDVDMTIWG